MGLKENHIEVHRVLNASSMQGEALDIERQLWERVGRENVDRFIDEGDGWCDTCTYIVFSVDKSVAHEFSK